MRNKCEMCKHIRYSYFCGFNEPRCRKKDISLVFGLNRDKWNEYASKCKEFELDNKKIFEKNEGEKRK